MLHDPPTDEDRTGTAPKLVDDVDSGQEEHPREVDGAGPAFSVESDWRETKGLGFGKNCPNLTLLRLEPEPGPATRPKNFPIARPKAKLKPRNIRNHVCKFEFKLADTAPRTERVAWVFLPSE